MRASILAALGVAAIGAGLWLGLPRGEEPGEGGRLLPDTGGPIVLAAASASSARRSTLRNAALITELGRELPERVELLLLTNDREAFRLEGPSRPVRFVALSAELPLTSWPQDPFLVLRRRGRPPVLLASRDFDRAADREMAGALADVLGWELRESPLQFEGGNVVSDTDTIFVGADTIARNVAALGLDAPAVARRFEALLGAEVVVLGPSPQPIPHIDLAVTPLGGGRIVVGDPGWGADLVDAAIRAEPELASRFEARLRANFFGHPEIDALVLADGTTLTPPPLEQGTQRAIAESRRLAPALDGIAQGLAELGRRVERVPLLVGEPAPGPEAGPGYPLLGYNNVLLEHGAASERVYLPRYGLRPLDEAAASAWRDLGFEVVEVDGVETSAMYGGGLRCALKVLARAE